MPKLAKQHGYITIESILLVIILVILAFTAWFVWSVKLHADKSYKNAQKSAMTRAERKRLPNVVVDPGHGTRDLVTFLRTNDTGCYKQPDQGTGWFRIVKEVNASQAELEYGCSKTYNQGLGTPDRILAHKTDGKWKLISPTNQWVYRIPSCTMLNDNNILAKLEPQCWTTQNAAGTIVVPNKNSQYADSYQSCLTAPDSKIAAGKAICVTKDGVVFSR